MNGKFILEEDQHHRRTKIRKGKDELKAILTVNYRFKKVIDYRTHRVENISPKYDRTVSINFAKTVKCIMA